MYQRLKQMLTPMLSAALSALLLLQPALAAGQPAAPQGWTSPFSDVKQENWFFPFVAALNSQAVISGYPDGRFGPNDAIRAGDAILMTLKAAGSGTLEPDSNRHYAAVYAQYAADKGFLAPEQIPADLDDSISRLFIVRLAAKALGLTAAEGVTPFADVDDGLVTAMYQKGLVAGDKVGDALLFHPDSSITRAQVSAIVWQVREYATHIHFGTYTLDILEKVPVNSYDPAAFRLDGDRMEYLGDGFETALGIDVSYHQGVIDWDKAAADGIQFAMLRAGGRYYGSAGALFQDTQFRANMEGALNAGLEVGVYFFSQAVTVDEAREEASFLLDLLKDYTFTGPVVFDWENITYDVARTDGVDRATVTAMANTFCQTVEQAGYSPMIYFNQYIGYLLYDLEEVVQYPFWLAQYSAAPGFYYNFQIWQYTDAGQVDGVTGKADMNLRLIPRRP